MLFSMQFLLSAIVSALATNAAAGLQSPNAYASNVIHDHVVHDQRHQSHSKNWMKISRAVSNDTLSMRIGLTQRNLENIEGLLMNISDPSSPTRGKHYTSEEIVELFAPSNTTTEVIKDWLSQGGIDNVRVKQSRDRGWFFFNASVGEVESLLHTTFYTYAHRKSGHVTISCEMYSIPQHVSQHLDFLTPDVELYDPPAYRGGKERSQSPTPKRAEFSSADRDPSRYPTNGPNDTSVCDLEVFPACIKALYNIPENNMAHTDNSLGIFLAGGQYAQGNLNRFFSLYAPGIRKGTHPIPAMIDGAKQAVKMHETEGEGDLDIQLAWPIIWPQSITQFQTDDEFYARDHMHAGMNHFLDAIDASYCNRSAFGESGDNPDLDGTYPDTEYPEGYQGKTQCGVYKPTNVISISMAGREEGFPQSYQMRQCTEFAKLGLRGTTVVVSSGDWGVAAPGNGDSGCLGPDDAIFSPQYPANCPWVIGVGATQINANKTVEDPESAAANIGFLSGGGFSNIYETPLFQKRATAAYFANHDPGHKYYSGLNLSSTERKGEPMGANGGVYNRIGRGYPDVAAVGNNIRTYTNNTWKLAHGTSASAPIFAGIITLINEHRLASGKGPLGFINHHLYANPDMFNDITDGDNANCKKKGFSAVKGWDPVTGLGTPNFPKMLEVLKAVP